MDTIKNSDDPRLTAYALGELEPGEQAAVEALLARSPEARAAVEQTRALAGLLAGELADEPGPGLAERHRAAIAHALERPPRSNGALRRLRPWLSAAAVLVVGVAAWQLGLREALVPRGSEVASSGVARHRSVGYLQDPQVSQAELAPPPAGDERARQLDGAVAQQSGGVDSAPPAGSAPFTYELWGAKTGAQPDAAAPADDDGIAFVEQRPQNFALPGGPSDSLAAAKGDGVTGADPAPAAPSNVSGSTGALTGYGRVAGGPIVGGQGGGGAGELVDSLESSLAKESRSPSDPAGADAVVSGVVAPATDPRSEVASAPNAAPAAPTTASSRSARGASARDGAMTSDQQPARAPVAKASELDPAALEALAALGYVGADVDDATEHLRALGYLGDRGDGRELPSRSQRREVGGESYAPIHENPFVPLTSDPLSRLSTFGVDVDSASYANVRRFLNMGQAPPADAVRLEELVNAFAYDDPAPSDGAEVPFSVTVESAAAPWAPEHRLVRVALKGAEHEVAERPAGNLVFLLDVSGSMQSADKLPLLVASLRLLVGELDADDRVAIVTYAGGTELVLPSTSCADKATILAALDRLSANGSTHASAGLQLAYEVAARNFLPGGINRVLLATDGDFNVGITGEGELERFIADKARSGVFLTVLGFGTGNYKDSKAEILADRGNGNYAYIDTLDEAHRVLVRQIDGTLVTIAKDVKLQVEFNPGRVAAYRLLGYENRALAAADFRDDRKDAGEIGAGHSVVALYEVVPVGVALGGVPGTADLKYGQAAPELPAAPLVESDELLTVNLRWKRPDASTGTELSVPHVDGGRGFAEASVDFRFSAAVASFGMVLRHSAYRGATTLAGIAAVAEAARGRDPEGYRAEFVRLVRVAQGLPGY